MNAVFHAFGVMLAQIRPEDLYKNQPGKSGDFNAELLVQILVGVVVVVGLVVLFIKVILPLLNKERQRYGLFNTIADVNKLTSEEKQALRAVAESLGSTNPAVAMVSKTAVEKYFLDKMNSSGANEKDSIDRLRQSVMNKLFT